PPLTLRIHSRPFRAEPAPRTCRTPPTEVFPLASRSSLLLIHSGKIARQTVSVNRGESRGHRELDRGGPLDPAPGSPGSLRLRRPEALPHRGLGGSGRP